MTNTNITHVLELDELPKVAKVDGTNFAMWLTRNSKNPIGQLKMFGISGKYCFDNYVLELRWTMQAKNKAKRMYVRVNEMDYYEVYFTTIRGKVISSHVIGDLEELRSFFWEHTALATSF